MMQSNASIYNQLGSKEYSRRLCGAAEQALGTFDAAIDTFYQGYKCPLKKTEQKYQLKRIEMLQVFESNRTK